MSAQRTSDSRWLLPSDTASVLVKGNDPPFHQCTSRSLLLERFADPRKRDQRKEYLKRIFDAKPCLAEERRNAWLGFINTACKPCDLLFGRLRSRLMVNMAGGVMENAGLCLDRFGLPYIPGSAVKGCARRAAIHALRHTPVEQEEQKAHKVDRLVEIALVFGWTDGDWSDSSDFAYGCQDGKSAAILEKAAEKLWQRIYGDRQPKGKLPQALPNFAGSVHFLPAHPYRLAERDLELDVVTCHHPEYYQGKKKTAFDCEYPIPVLFLTVAPGSIFVFPLQAARHGGEEWTAKAQAWLKRGLETMGIGAKTGAGYGWCDCSEQVQKKHQEEIVQQREEHERAQKRASLEPDPERLNSFKSLKEDNLRGKINDFKDEEVYWTNQDDTYQLSLFHYLTKIDTQIYEKERHNPKSKVLRALKNLAKKFGKTPP
ncbi:type III-B CRISPR module RAMP protein Cmr6 [Methylacidimicrobium sp. B4]|uniref:type III-B CRISPR module RAMP protein Cmr6 n=1 Tax=Methylacidimicrobium sp. B4 TaxID=2796139 RepID=UPI001A900FD5|nr:type III-B CRISPR module RAMP protein Cmr6 [Methylacidimicrobium sp. B4]QSR84640.1 type III-B CRISPR module RAMP protein Cmr6 [Methylacidimicrobium sp. B4]